MSESDAERGFRLLRATAPTADWRIVCSWRVRGAATLGAKARGLVGLPAPWVPEWIEIVPTGGVEEDSASLAAEIAEHLLLQGTRLIARSDGPGEQYRPGEGESSVIAASWDALTAAVSTAICRTPRSWPMVQVAIDPAGLGVLSNDRRVSRTPDDWVAEGPLNHFQPSQLRIKAISPSGAPLGCPLSAGDDKLEHVLARVAGILSGRRERQRCEWLWDGERVWVVQADAIQDPVSDPAAVQELCRPVPWTPPAGRASDLAWSGPKAESWRLFASRGWPTVPIAAITAAEWPSLNGRAWITARSRAYHDPLVVRTDLLSAEGQVDLLPTSSPSRDPDQLFEFIQAAFTALGAAGHEATACAALASPLVPVRVSALASAGPGCDHVRIDALWGFPDGLLYLPHDTFEVEAAEVRSTIRCKPACLLLAQDARLEVRLGAPLDWGETLNREEVHQIARWARATSVAVGEPVRLMALARLGGQQGASHCIPFHFFRVRRSTSRESQSVLRTGGVVAVRDPATLENLPSGAGAISLEPGPRYARDIRFLREVASVGRKRGIVILFSGSPLGHARFILEREGATVVIGTPEAIDGFPVIAKTRAGLLRLRTIPEDLALTMFAEQLARSSPEPRERPTDVRGLARAAVDAGYRSKSFPDVPLLADDIASRLPPTADGVGSPPRFMDDAERRSDLDQ